MLVLQVLYTFSFGFSSLSILSFIAEVLVSRILIYLLKISYFIITTYPTAQYIFLIRDFIKLYTNI